MTPIMKAKAVAKMLKRKASNDDFILGRAFDNHFENGDGDLVVCELAKLILEDDILFIACKKCSQFISVYHLLQMLEDHYKSQIEVIRKITHGATA
jgi:hypothetical protein